MIQTFFDFPVYFKFFIGLFALVNPVGIIPVFISMTSYQTAAARNKTNLTANLSVAIILWISLLPGEFRDIIYRHIILLCQLLVTRFTFGINVGY